MTVLRLEFCGEPREVPPTEQFTFGRLGDLQIDDNRYLHRLMGSFSWKGDLWWLSNVGSHVPLHIEGRFGGSSITLSPGSSIPLVFGSSYIRFAAGGTSYELLIDADPVMASSTTFGSEDGEATVDASDMHLSPEQLLLIVALAETRLLKGNAAELPSNVDVAKRFGWSMTKFNRKLDNVCMKFHRKGVAGLVGSNDRVAQQRRRALVDHVIASGLVTADQLALLPPKGTAPLVATEQSHHTDET